MGPGGPARFGGGPGAACATRGMRAAKRRWNRPVTGGGRAAGGRGGFGEGEGRRPARTASSCPPPRRRGAGPDARCPWPAPRAALRGARPPAWGGSGGLAPGVAALFYRQLWSGNRTRDYRFMRPMLYPTELSSGAACRIRTCDPRLRKPVLSPLSQCRNRGNHFARASAYATAGPRAPDGTQARTAVARRHGFRIAVSRETAIRGRSAARRRHAGCMELLSRTPKTKCPRHGVRGHSLSLGRSG